VKARLTQSGDALELIGGNIAPELIVSRAGVPYFFHGQAPGFSEFLGIVLKFPD